MWILGSASGSEFLLAPKFCVNFFRNFNLFSSVSCADGCSSIG